MLYVNKVRRYSDGITEAHIIDDDLKEEIATVTGFVLDHIYYGDNDLNIIKRIPYNEKNWNTVRA